MSRVIKCDKCNQELLPHEYYIELNDLNYCENCFFDKAVKLLSAKEKKVKDYDGESDE